MNNSIDHGFNLRQFLGKSAVFTHKIDLMYIEKNTKRLSGKSFLKKGVFVQ